MDWIKMGWGDNFSPEFSAETSLSVDCSNAIISNRPLLEISRDAIQRIISKYPPPYTLFCTGGIDSQAMLYCWKNSGVDFNVLSFTYNKTLNDFDLLDLHSFATNQGIKVSYKDFDMIDFLENRFPDYAHRYQCISPQITAYMAMSEEVSNGTVFFSGNFISPESCFFDYTILGLHRYVQQTQRSMVPFFFQHDSELAGACIPIFEELIAKANSNKFESGSYDFKCRTYKLAGIPIVIQLEKYSGFEKIKDYYDTQRHLVSGLDRAEFAKLYRTWRVFDIHFRLKMTRHIKYINKINYIFSKKQ